MIKAGMILILFLLQVTILCAFQMQGEINLIKDYLSEETKLKINDFPVKLSSYLNSAPYSQENLNLQYQITLSLKEKSSGNVMMFTAEGQFYEENYRMIFP